VALKSDKIGRQPPPVKVLLVRNCGGISVVIEAT